MNGLFLTSTAISWVTADRLIQEQRHGDLFEDLGSFLEQHATALGLIDNKLDLVIDHSLYHFQPLVLPYLRGSKAQQVVQFELENLLIPPAAELNYPFQTHSNKAKGITQLAVYGIKKSWLQEIRAFFEPYSLEMRKLFSLENLLVAQVALAEPLVVYVHRDANVVRVMFLKNGLIESISQLAIGPESKDGRLQQWASRINGLIGAAEIWEQPREVRCNEAASELFTVTLKGQLEAKRERLPLSGESRQSAEFKELLDPSFLKQKNILPLQSAPAALWAELQKNRIPLKRLAITAGIGVLLWSSWIGFGLYQGHQQVSDLKTKYKTALAQYAPGLSTVNGLSVLTDKVNALRSLAGSRRQVQAYPYSGGISNISKIKLKAPSLVLSRLSAKDGDWTLVGETDTSQDFEQTKKELKKLFDPAQYSMTVSQKAKEGKVNFTISLLSKRQG